LNKEKVKLNVCSIKDCGRPTHKESEYCIFHAKPEEKTEKEFKKALEKYIEKIKENNLDYNFIRFIFVGDIDFREGLSITIFKNANFWEATFEGYAAFAGVTFKGDVSFIKTTFKGEVHFDRTTFEGDASFVGATFEGDASFVGATFEGEISFDRATFKGDTAFFYANFKMDASFWEVTFEGYALYSMATFEGYANWVNTTFEYTGFDETTFKENVSFDGTIFKGDAFFEGATFEKDAEFIVKNIKKNMNFANTVFNSRKTLKINTLDIVNEVVINFEKAYLENVYLELILGGKTLIYFTTEEIFRNIIIKGNQIKNHILQEESKDFEQAKEVYLLLKNNFHSIGRYEDESWAFKKEKDMERKNNCHFKTLHKWLYSCFLNGIFGYGEQPGKVIVSAILVILLFASFFMISGISNVGIEFNTSNNFLDCLYFSTVTFTTLGYGDFRPLEGWGRILAGSEAFVGAFMMALFVYTFARRTGGR